MESQERKLELATGKALPDFEWSQRAWQTREYVRNEFLQIFVDDRLVYRDATAESRVLQRHGSDGQNLWMGRRMCGFSICGMYAEMHENRAV